MRLQFRSCVVVKKICWVCNSRLLHLCSTTIVLSRRVFVPWTVSMQKPCSVSDDTGTCRLWGTAIQEVANHKSYSITDVRVKTFNSINYLTSTPATTLTIAKESYEPPSEKDSPEFSMPYQITFQKSYWLIVARLGWSAWNLEYKSLKLQQPPCVLLNVPFAALCNLSPHVTWKDPFPYKSNQTTMLNLSG